MCEIWWNMFSPKIINGNEQKNSASSIIYGFLLEKLKVSWIIQSSAFWMQPLFLRSTFFFFSLHFANECVLACMLPHRTIVYYDDHEYKYVYENGRRIKLLRRHSVLPPMPERKTNSWRLSYLAGAAANSSCMLEIEVYTLQFGPQRTLCIFHGMMHRKWQCVNEPQPRLSHHAEMCEWDGN